MILFRLLLCLGSFFILSSLTAQSDLVKGNKLYELGAYPEAIGAYTQAVNSDDRGKAYLGIARSYYEMNVPTLAVQYFNKADELKYFSRDDKILYTKSQIALENYAGAAEILKDIQGEDVKAMQRKCEFALNMPKVNENLRIKGMEFNTPASEYSVFMHDDNLIYASNREDIKRTLQVKNIRNSPTQLYKINVKGGKSRFLRPDLKEHEDQGTVAYSPDGKWVAYTKDALSEDSRFAGNRTNMTLYLAKVGVGDEWEETTAFDHNMVGFSTGYPSFGKDGSILYFSSNRPGGIGGYDIYMSRQEGNTWSTPINLGPIVNSRGNEISPHYKDGYLYFSSDLLPGLGGMDVFRVKADNPTGLVINMGPGINSSRDDFNFVISHDHEGYFISNRPGGAGKEDVYLIHSQEPLTHIGHPVMMEEVSPAVTKVHDEQEEQINIYTIQVASLSRIEGALDIYVNKLSDIGSVFKVHYSNGVKVRVGIFREKFQAEEALEKVKEKGFKDAFIVNEFIVSESTFKPELKEAIGLYKVRLATYADPKWFNAEKVAHLGTVEKVEKGDMTIFLLGSYDRIEDAENVRIKAIRAGFTSAQLIKEQDNKWINIR